MAANLSPWLWQQFTDDNGVPRAGAKVFFYVGGTFGGADTKKDAFTDETGAVAHTNPMILDSAGMPPTGSIYLGTGTYDIVIAPSTDTDPPVSAYKTITGVSVTGGEQGVANTITDLRALLPDAFKMVSVIGYHTLTDIIELREYYWDSTSTLNDNGGTVITPDTSGGAGRWRLKYDSTLNPKWFGAKGDGVTVDHTQINNAVFAFTNTDLAKNQKIVFTDGVYLISSLVAFGDILSGIDVEFHSSASLTSTGSVAVEFFGKIFSANQQQIFAGNVAPTLEVGNSQDYRQTIHCNWFGDNGLSKAITMANGIKVPVYCDYENTLAANLTVPSNVQLEFGQSGSVTGAYTLTVNGFIEAGVRNIFDTSTTVTFGLSVSIPTFYPQWWGATADGVDDYASINAAATAVSGITNGGELRFVRGTYEILTNLTFPTGVNIVAENGCLFSSATTKTITFNTGFTADLYQVFAASLGQVTFNPVSGVVAIPQWWGAKGDNPTTNNTVALQSCLDSSERVRIPSGSYLTDAITANITMIDLVCEGTLSCRTNGITVLSIPADVSRDYVKTIKGLRIKGNGKTGATGLKIGTTTALLYLDIEDCIIADFITGGTGVSSLVSQEHHYDSVVCENNETGFKWYSDASNGGNTASLFTSCRFQKNVVGLIIKNNFPAFTVPLHNNSFDSVTFQENTVCGSYIYGAGGISFRNAHFENNGGTASATIDGLVVSESDMEIDGSSVNVTDTDNASNLVPSFIVKNSSTLNVRGVTGYGTGDAMLYKCDNTSMVIENGQCRAIGIKEQLTDYGSISSISSSGMSTMGYPKISMEVFDNNYDTNSARDPLLPDLTNRTGTASEQITRTEMGLTNQVTFAAAVGNISTHRLQMLTTVVTGSPMISSFMMKTDKASTVMNVQWFANGVKKTSGLFTLDTKWRRYVFTSGSEVNHEVFIFPVANDAPTVSIKYVMSYTGSLQEISRIYQQGTVGLTEIIANRGNAAPTAGTWKVGEKVYNRTPTAATATDVGFICTTAGTPGTWKGFGDIA